MNCLFDCSKCKNFERNYGICNICTYVEGEEPDDRYDYLDRCYCSISCKKNYIVQCVDENRVSTFKCYYYKPQKEEE